MFFPSNLDDFIDAAFFGVPRLSGATRDGESILIRPKLQSCYNCTFRALMVFGVEVVAEGLARDFIVQQRRWTTLEGGSGR